MHSQRTGTDLPDPNVPFVVHTDASGFAVGAVLQQDQGKGLQPIAFLSKKMLDAETRYPVHEQELLAIIHALKYMATLSSWCEVQVIVKTDHKSLQYFKTQPPIRSSIPLAGCHCRFDFDIEYVEGKTNVVADGLSRRHDHQPASRSCRTSSVAMTHRISDVSLHFTPISSRRVRHDADTIDLLKKKSNDLKKLISVSKVVFLYYNKRSTVPPG